MVSKYASPLRGRRKGVLADAPSIIKMTLWFFRLSGAESRGDWNEAEADMLVDGAT
jgi:hypothetical protein